MIKQYQTGIHDIIDCTTVTGFALLCTSTTVTLESLPDSNALVKHKMRTNINTGIKNKVHLLSSYIIYCTQIRPHKINTVATKVNNE